MSAVFFNCPLHYYLDNTADTIVSSNYSKDEQTKYFLLSLVKRNPR